MRLIDADALYEKATVLWDKSDSEDFEKGIFKLILNAPTIDAVSVVRCKDCRHWYKKMNKCNRCPSISGNWGANDFCSYGERKEP